MLFSVLLSTLAGSCIVLQRIVNAKTSAKSSTLAACLYNYIFGLAGAVAVMLLLGRSDFTHAADLKKIPVWMYIGGPLGIVTVGIAAFVAPKISQLVMSLLMFVGQVFASVFIDIIIQGSVNIPNIVGGIFALAGLLLINLDVDKNRERS
ncbi:MAG: DMT family transporter [Treponema sp.]|jgi:transporter family-2 protein|nr:DMT family transporter [Treponema sp.]